MTIRYAPKMTATIAITLSFLLGSIPLSWIIAKARYNVDLRTSGDGNVGAGNLQRITGLKIGIFAIIADLAKGGFAIGLTVLINDTSWVIMMAGTAAVLGHIFPPWLGFNGGRGAATAIGVAMGIIPIPGAFMLLIGLLMMLIVKRTLPSIAIAMTSVIVLGFILGEPVSYMIFLIVLFIAVGMKDAIDRLGKA
tara:strand:- start:186 stop:767 length:582 start_codon:yes stop_codon:yes gene_type:complete